MSTFLRSALVVLAILSSASAAMARPIHHPNATTPLYDANSPENVKAFWDNMQRSGS